MGVLYLDTETTGLDPTRHVPWEVAIVEPDGTGYVWCWRPRDTHMRAADPKALEIGRFRERAPLAHQEPIERAAAHAIADLVEGNVIVGSNPHFDVSMLTPWMNLFGRDWDAHYRPVCAITMAAGWLHANGADHLRLLEPWSSYGISKACGVAPPEDEEAHTALGDARWVKRLYERVTGPA